jgi:GTP-binding protein
MKIALIGLPNVGKSTLFNRLLEQRQAIETNIPGTTRDQNRGILVVPPVAREAKGGMAKIELIDTPGLLVEHGTHLRQGFGGQAWNMEQQKDADKILGCSIQLQARRALEQADLILYMIDFTLGATTDDRKIIKKLQKQNKPTILVVTKAHKPADQIEALK